MYHIIRCGDYKSLGHTPNRETAMQMCDALQAQEETYALYISQDGKNVGDAIDGWHEEDYGWKPDYNLEDAIYRFD